MKTKLTDTMIEWLAGGNRGISSNTIFEHLTGYGATQGLRSHPHDPDDLTRCVRLLEACPELRSEFHRMAEASEVWERLVQNWDELVSMLDSEVPGWREHISGLAPKTYARMKELGC